MPEAHPTGSLGRHIIDATRALLNAHDPANGKPIFSAQTNGGPHTRNPACWINSLDNLTSSMTWANVTPFLKYNGAPITPKHDICTWHYKPGVGAKVPYALADGSLHISTVASRTSISGTDMCIVEFEEERPSGVEICQVLPANIDDVLVGLGRERIVALRISRLERAVTISITGHFGSGSTVGWLTPPASPESEWWESIVPGDSGSQISWLINNRKVLICCVTSYVGWLVHKKITEISAVLGDYSLSIVDLSAFDVPDAIPDPPPYVPPEDDGMPPPIKTIGPGKDYTSLSAFFTAMISDGNPWWGEMYTGSLGTVSADVNTLSTEAEPVKLYAAPGETPQVDVASGWGVTIEGAYVDVGDLYVRATGSAGGGILLRSGGLARVVGAKVRNCRFGATSTNKFSEACINLGGNYGTYGGSVVAANYAYNCLAAFTPMVRIALDSESTETTTVINNTLYDTTANVYGISIDDAAASVVVRNNAMLCAVPYSVGGSPTASHNMSSTGTTLGSSGVINAVAADVLVDPTTSDELKAASAAIGAGTNVSLATDRVGVPYGSPPSAGSREYVVPAPDAPGDVAATDGTHTDKVVVTWAASSGATGYKVYRHTSDSSGSASLLDTLGDVQTYDDSTVTPGTTYYYWVKAAGAGGDSDFSASDSGYAEEPAAESSASTGARGKLKGVIGRQLRGISRGRG